ncbi:MAG: glutamate-5-semialdehyde dehydrogenase [Candidatus Omnitrophica bacterium]|nr:glutamate-5-semialdehyde dehydrogenase [Candidatus Omnitrophota bacterium]
MSLVHDVTGQASRARSASYFMSSLSSAEKNTILKDMAGSLLAEQAYLIRENKKDIRAARAAKLSRALLDRLTLTQGRIDAMAAGLYKLAELADPCGEVIRAWRVSSGLWIHKVRVPLGVAAIIYESRPNVTADCIGLCFKSGNCVILKGGSEALNSNRAIYRLLAGVLKRHGLPEGVVEMIDTTRRRAVNVLLGLDRYIDVVIPRGGEGLINMVAKMSRIPVIKHYKGVCHVFVDEWADLNMAQSVCFNAKVQRPGVCNAMESLLVHREVAARFLPPMAKKFRDAGVKLKGCPSTCAILKGKGVRRATEEDFRTEYLDLVLSVKVVDGMEEAVEHINGYGSHHSDAIITENYENAVSFLNRIDSACVYVNASTRFTDGDQFGMGAEIGISTDKIHARGPMGLEELTTYKYMVFGNGQIRA